LDGVLTEGVSAAAPIVVVVLAAMLMVVFMVLIVVVTAVAMWEARLHKLRPGIEL
jgi:hypothetical protein